VTTSAPHATSLDPCESALGYAARGWPVLPLHSPCSSGCSCGQDGCSSVGKHPRLADGVHGASRRPETIAAWWRRWPDAGVGVATGGQLVVLDVDGDAGRASLRGRVLPPTPTVRTGNGWHYYYRTPWPVPCRVGLLEGVDVRGVGGYVVAPPSLHASGRRYSTAPGLGFNEVEFARLPAWLLAVLTAPAAPRPPQHWQALVRDGVGEGSRNATVASLAGHLLRRDVDARVVLELLAAWNEGRCRPPLSAAEVERTVDSVARAEARRRGRQ